jgi:hypothetical protein
MDTLQGNAVVAQPRGPTSVISSSACGVFQKCLRQLVFQEIASKCSYNSVDPSQQRAMQFPLCPLAMRRAWAVRKRFARQALAFVNENQ